MEPIKLQNLLTKFVSLEDKKIDKLALRKYVYDELQRMYAWTEYLLHNPEYRDKWRTIGDYVESHDGRPEQEAWRLAVGEITTLDQQIKGWIDDHVDSDERMEFSIASKAAEISSGNEMFDYYHALMVRHDQLLACVEVFCEAAEKLAAITKLPDVGAVVESESFKFFTEKTIAQHIYEMAKIMFKLREGGAEN